MRTDNGAIAQCLHRKPICPSRIGVVLPCRKVPLITSCPSASNNSSCCRNIVWYSPRIASSVSLYKSLGNCDEELALLSSSFLLLAPKGLCVEGKPMRFPSMPSMVIPVSLFGLDIASMDAAVSADIVGLFEDATHIAATAVLLVAGRAKFGLATAREFPPALPGSFRTNACEASGIN